MWLAHISQILVAVFFINKTTKAETQCHTNIPQERLSVVLETSYIPQYLPSPTPE